MNFLPFEDEYLRKTLFLKDCIIKIPITLKAQTVHLLFTDKTQNIHQTKSLVFTY
jgi:hypothetical protein